MFLPGMDGHKADCVWEANSVEALQIFLDREIGSGATNEYFQVDDASALGLPTHTEMHHTTWQSCLAMNEGSAVELARCFCALWNDA
jgi:hypothetical protein